MINPAPHLQSQYTAALAMMRMSLTSCPDDEWNDPRHSNRFWHIAYHTLFYTALYLSAEDAPVLWEGCKPNHQEMTKDEWLPDFHPDTSAYTKGELLGFISWLETRIQTCFDEVPYDAPSHFSWIPFNRFELYVYNLRHLQHHVGQLSERVKQTTGTGVRWVGRA